MSFLEKVAEAPNQREALLLIAGALDIILEAITEQTASGVEGDEWNGGWSSAPTRMPDPEQYGGEAPAREPAKPMERDGADWVIPPAPAELQQRRRDWAEQYLPGLGASTGDELRASEGPAYADLVNAYTKGGPEWLTAYDTEFVLTLPPNARQAMALDYQERGLNQEALEFSVAFLQGEATSMANAAPMADTLPGAPR